MSVVTPTRITPEPAPTPPATLTSASRVEQEPAPAVQAYPPVADAPRSAAEAFRDRFGAIETKAREKRCHAYVAEAIGSLSRGDYKAAAESYRLAAELAPNDAVLARKAAEIAKLAQRRRR
jgi:hypothetical protein